MPAGAASRYALGAGGVGAARPAPAASLISASRYALGALTSSYEKVLGLVQGGTRGLVLGPVYEVYKGSYQARLRRAAAPSIGRSTC